MQAICNLQAGNVLPFRNDSRVSDFTATLRRTLSSNHADLLELQTRQYLKREYECENSYRPSEAGCIQLEQDRPRKRLRVAQASQRSRQQSTDEHTRRESTRFASTGPRSVKCHEQEGCLRGYASASGRSQAYATVELETSIKPEEPELLQAVREIDPKVLQVLLLFTEEDQVIECRRNVKPLPYIANSISEFGRQLDFMNAFQIALEKELHGVDMQPENYEPDAQAPLAGLSLQLCGQHVWPRLDDSDCISS